MTEPVRYYNRDHPSRGYVGWRHPSGYHLTTGEWNARIRSVGCPLCGALPLRPCLVVAPKHHGKPVGAVTPTMHQQRALAAKAAGLFY